MRDITAIQTDVMVQTAGLARIRFKLSGLVAELYRDHLPPPRGEEWERMSEGTAAPSVAWYLAGTLDAIEDDRLKPVEDDLRAAAEITAAVLEPQFEQERRK